MGVNRGIGGGGLKMGLKWAKTPNYWQTAGTRSAHTRLAHTLSSSLKHKSEISYK